MSPAAVASMLGVRPAGVASHAVTAARDETMKASAVSAQ